jgi:hypothetical protein
MNATMLCTDDALRERGLLRIGDVWIRRRDVLGIEASVFYPPGFTWPHAQVAALVAGGHKLILWRESTYNGPDVSHEAAQQRADDRAALYLDLLEHAE